MKVLFYFLLVLLFYSCNSEKKKPETESQKEEFNPPTKEDTLGIKELVIIFNRKVVNSHLEAPRPETGPNGFYYINIKKHQERLRKLGIFTEKFIQGEVEKFMECHNNLEKLKLNKDNVEEGIDYYGVEGCDWFHATYYTANQDPDPHCDLIGLKIKGDLASGQLHYFRYYDKKKAFDKRLYTQLKFVKIEGKWRIDFAERVWNE